MKLVIKRSDGGVTIAPYEEGMNVEQYIETWEGNANPNIAGRPELNLGTCVGHEIVADAEIPTDKTFRNAWCCNGTSIGCDMPKARAIHRDRLRKLRRPRFEVLDAEWMKCSAKADSAGAAAAEDKRQQLRDAPAYPAIDAATTPDELKVAIPEILRS